MKLAIAVVWRAVVLYLCALAGFVAALAAPALRVTHVVSRTATNVRTYDYDWIIAVCLGTVAMLLISAARRRIRLTWMPTLIAFVLVLAIVLLFTQLGVKDTALYS